jgi:hypothetical protein
MRVALSIAAYAGVFVIGVPVCAQSPLTPRLIGAASGLVSVGDLRGFDVNPAGLVHMRDWDLTIASYGAPGGRTGGAVFQGIALGKRFLGSHALALQYAPGTSMMFTVPTTVLLGSGTPVASDERVEYDERFAISYAMQPFAGFSAGITARLRATSATDTRFELRDIDTTSLIVPDQRTYEQSAWLGDAGILWEPADGVSVGVVGRNILALESQELPTVVSGYMLPHSAALEIGAAARISPYFRFGADVSTQQTMTAGVEMTPMQPLNVRIGTYCSTVRGPLVTAVGAGIGLTYDFISVDLGYLRYLNQDRRNGRVSLDEFHPSDIKTLDMNPYAADRLAVSVKAVFGAVREQLARIASVDIHAGIYPSSSATLAYAPVGTVRVQNVSSQPVQARASFLLDRFMDAPTESQPVTIPPGEAADISLTAVFNERLQSVPEMTVREGTVFVHAASDGEPEDRYQTRVVIYGRNDWDGDVFSLRYFVTPGDPTVIRTARDILLERQDSLRDVPGALQLFRKIQLLVNAFAGRLIYVGDPRQSADNVQYPSETLDLRGGDCDDLTVCFSSLINSIGISTAFVDVLPPGRPRDGHIYLLVDTGVEPRFASEISSNPKRFVIRKGSAGRETVWIPIETTVIRNGFDEAWSSGAQRYFDDVEIGLGVAKGWVRIVDVQ